MADKKVLLVSRPIVPPWDEASKNFAYNLALKLRGVELTILTDQTRLDLPNNVHQLPIYTKPALDYGQRLRLFKLRSQTKNYDIIHFLFTPTKLNTVLSKSLQKKTGKTIQTIATLRGYYHNPKALKKILHSDLIITYSNYSKDILNKMGFSNVTCIYPGIDLENYQPRPKNQELAKQLGIKSDDFVVSYPGEYTRLGCTDMLVEILPELAKKIPNLKFVFACRVKNQADARKKQAVIAAVKSSGLTGSVIYTDTLKDMAGLYNLSDVVVFPVASMEGKFDVPLVIIEAMACAKPMVVSDLAVLNEFTNTKTTVRISSGDGEKLITKLVELYDKPALRKSLGSDAQKYVKQTFDIDKVTAKYQKVYKELLDGPA